MAAPKKRTLNGVANHALRREANEKRHARNVDRLRDAGIPFGSGQMRPSRVVRMAERAYVRSLALDDYSAHEVAES